jgi:Na+-driven multidrug efflux pump
LLQPESRDVRQSQPGAAHALDPDGTRGADAAEARGPNIVLMMIQAVMVAVDAFYVGWLGADALAGIALVLPAMMLMTAMSGAALGGGIAAGVSRALGRGDRAQADLIASHALVLSVICAAVFALVPLIGGEAFYASMGGKARHCRRRWRIQTLSSAAGSVCGC